MGSAHIALAIFFADQVCRCPLKDYRATKDALKAIQLDIRSNFSI